jgi:hypothetical protein
MPQYKEREQVMRGKAFHNQIAEEAKAVFSRYGWQVYTEHRYRKNGITTYLDLFAVKGNQTIACEVETTSRHAADNALKAQTVGVALWIIVPTRKLRRQIEGKLKSSAVIKNHQSIKTILLSQLNTELILLRKEQSHEN